MLTSRILGLSRVVQGHAVGSLRKRPKALSHLGHLLILVRNGFFGAPSGAAKAIDLNARPTVPNWKVRFIRTQIPPHLRRLSWPEQQGFDAVGAAGWGTRPTKPARGMSVYARGWPKHCEANAAHHGHVRCGPAKGSVANPSPVFKNLPQSSGREFERKNRSSDRTGGC